jgi:hypothetical protein
VFLVEISEALWSKGLFENEYLEDREEDGLVKWKHECVARMGKDANGSESCIIPVPGPGTAHDRFSQKSS